MAFDAGLIDPNEIRAEFARIRRRYEGVDDAIVPMRATKLNALEAYVEQAEEHKARCTCGAHESAFTISHASDAPAYRALDQARIDRLVEADARSAL